MLMTNEKPLTEIERRIARIGEQLATPKKPARLQAADNTALVARRICAVAQQEHQDLCRKRFELPTELQRSMTAEVTAAEASVTEKRTAANAASSTQRAERDKYAAEYLQQIGPAATAAKAMLVELVEHLDTMATLLRDAHNFATLNALESPRIVTNAPVIQAYARQFKELLA